MGDMDSRSAALCLTRSDRPHEPPMSRHILLVPETVRREKIVRELLGRHRLSLNAHRDDGRARPDPALDKRSLAVERLRDLALGGRLRQPLLGQLDDL